MRKKEKRKADKRKKNPALLFLMGSILLWSVITTLFSQDLSVSARVDDQKIGEQDQLQLTVEISGPEAGSIKSITLPSMKNLRVVAGPSVSTRFQWVNGVSSSFKSFSYVLLPEAKGEAEIPAIIISQEGRSYRTEPIKVEIVGGSLRKRESPRRQVFPGTMEDEGQRRGTEPDLFVQASLDKERLHQGEQVTLSYKVRTSVPILDINLEEMPSYEGFWVEELKVDPQSTERVVNVNGKRYTEYTIMKKALFPSASGRKTIKPLTLAISVRAGSGDIFDSLFRDRSVKVFRKTESLSMEVLPLPEKRTPGSFSGAVGDFRMSVEADRKECAVNDAVGVKVMVEGEGNLKGVSPPAIADAPDFKVYEPKVSEQARFDGDRMKSKKVWDYIFIPLNAGDHSIPEVSFSYFRPSRNGYEELKSASIPVSVKKGAAETPSAPVVQKGDITPLRRDILFIKPLRGEIGDCGQSYHRAWWFYFLLLIPVLLTPSYILLSLRRERVRQDIGLGRMKKASRNARKGFRRTRKLIGSGHVELAMQEISKALVGYAADKFNQSPSGLTYEKIEEMLDARGVDAERTRRFITILERGDYSRFAMGSRSVEQASALLSEAEASLSELEKLLS